MYLLAVGLAATSSAVFTLKLFASGADVDDDVGDVSEDGSEEHETEDELHDHKEQFGFGSGFEETSHGGQRQRAHVETLQVLLHTVVVVHSGRKLHGPVACHVLEAIVSHHDVIEAGVPVEDDEQVVNEGDGSEHVGVVGVALGAVHEGPEAVDFH